MRDELTIFKDYLKQKNLRWTPQRKTVLEVLLKLKGHIEIEELHGAIRVVDPSMGIATVYRTIHLLTECGLVRENVTLSGRKTYEQQYRRGHHDHLICIRCNKIVEFEHPLIEQFQLEACRAQGFIMETPRMELFGICSNCRK